MSVKGISRCRSFSNIKTPYTCHDLSTLAITPPTSISSRTPSSLPPSLLRASAIHPFRPPPLAAAAATNRPLSPHFTFRSARFICRYISRLRGLTVIFDSFQVHESSNWPTMRQFVVQRFFADRLIHFTGRYLFQEAWLHERVR